MKLQDLFETVDPKLDALFKKHNLKPNKAGSSVEDFDYTDTIGKEFEAAGHKLNFNSKSGKFDVKSMARLAKAADDAAVDFQARNITGRVQGFTPRRKMK